MTFYRFLGFLLGAAIGVWLAWQGYQHWGHMRAMLEGWFR